MVNRRQVRASYFVFIGLPLLGFFVYFLTRGDPQGRGLVIIDAPADVTVTIDERPLLPCKHEYNAPTSCKVEPQPGFARRYGYEAYRDTTLHIVASRGSLKATIDAHVDATAPAPHLRLDGDAFAWVDVGGVRVTNGKAFFVDKNGAVVGPVGDSEPD
jgi:hypothetical protein